MAASRSIDSPAVKRAMDAGATYLDVRTEEEFRLGHVPGAYNIPWMFGDLEGLHSNVHFAQVASARWTRGAALIVGCRSGSRARAAAEVLTARGFDTTLDIDGWDGHRDAFGRSARGWSANGFNVEQGESPGRGYRALATAASVISVPEMQHSARPKTT